MSVEQRIFPAAMHEQPADGEPIRSVVLATADCSIVVWHVKPGQAIAPHVHPRGQDTWTVLSGTAVYQSGGGVTEAIVAGDIAVARPGEVHGALNQGPDPFVFVSVVAPGDAGYASAAP